MSLSEIGDLFDITRERVRQVREKGLRALRNKSRNKVLRTYL
jgi:RNA polymerase primary sigma factor